MLICLETGSTYIHTTIRPFPQVQVADRAVVATICKRKTHGSADSSKEAEEAEEASLWNHGGELTRRHLSNLCFEGGFLQLHLQSPAVRRPVSSGFDSTLPVELRCEDGQEIKADERKLRQAEEMQDDQTRGETFKRRRSISDCFPLAHLSAADSPIPERRNVLTCMKATLQSAGDGRDPRRQN
ncbi:uncharacterized protein AB9W97_003048 isoform 1-T2 [Spinachia spinachia]